MIQTIHLPFGKKVEVCDICGNRDFTRIDKCRKAGAPQPPPVAVGDTVPLYHQVWRGSGSVRSDEPVKYTVTGFSYAAPVTSGFRLAMALAANTASAADAWEEAKGPVHRLEVEVARDDDGIHSIGTYSCDEFLLWQEGDPAKLEAARLIFPPKPEVARPRTLVQRLLHPFGLGRS